MSKNTISNKKDDTYSEAETEARREATLKKLLKTPPKPRKGSKVGRAEARPPRSSKKNNQPD